MACIINFLLCVTVGVTAPSAENKFDKIPSLDVVKKVIVMLLQSIRAREGVVVESHSYVTSPLNRNSSFRPWLFYPQDERLQYRIQGQIF